MGSMNVINRHWNYVLSLISPPVQPKHSHMHVNTHINTHKPHTFYEEAAHQKLDIFWDRTAILVTDRLARQCV